MDLYSGHINNLINELAALPGIGSKSAQRLAFYIIGMSPARVKKLADALVTAKENVHYCQCCQNLTDTEICPICSNPKRDRSTIMVVENPRDLAAYERTGKYEGLYHVLHGAISPMLGIGPADIKLKELMERLRDDEVKEVIVATNSSLEGETTAAKWVTFAEIREMIKNREICRIIGRQFLNQEPQLLERQELGYR